MCFSHHEIVGAALAAAGAIWLAFAFCAWRLAVLRRDVADALAEHGITITAIKRGR